MKKLNYYESYSGGSLRTSKQIFRPLTGGSPGNETVYYDSLYNNSPRSYLIYQTDKNIPLYKEYLDYCESPPKSLQRVYFAEHKESTSKYRPLIGFHGTLQNGLDEGLKPRGFLELGISKKYISSLYIDTTKRYYENHNLAYHALNFSLLGSTTGGKFTMAEKATISYLFFVFRAEAGLINYHDFNKSDPRFCVGAGMSAFGYVNFIFNYSVPLTRNRFNDVGRMALSVFIN